MLRIRFTADDLAAVRFAARPGPLAETHTALLTLHHPGTTPLLGPWKARLLRGTPPAAAALADVVPDGYAPRFLDVYDDSLPSALDTLRSARPARVAAELERAYARAPRRPPPWIHDLRRGSRAGWAPLLHAERAAFGHLVAPVWAVVQDLHRAEFARHALTAAERGVAAALTEAAGGRFADGAWELPGPATEVDVAGRGLELRPTFHWSGPPLLADEPDRPVTLVYAARALPPVPDGHGGGDGLAGVLGRTRAAILRELDTARGTGDLARRLGVSDATVSAHAAALRRAGLVTTTHTGRSVEHRRTATATLLLR